MERFFSLVAETPGIGVKRNCGRAGMLRMFPVSGFQNWLMFYREAADHVLIARIIHAKRDLPTLFGEKGG